MIENKDSASDAENIINSEDTEVEDWLDKRGSFRGFA